VDTIPALPEKHDTSMLQGQFGMHVNALSLGDWLVIFNSECTRNHLSAGVCLNLLPELTVIPVLLSCFRGEGTPGQERETQHATRIN